MAFSATGVPTAYTQLCPRCKALRSWVNVNGGTTYRCSGCEWTWTLQTPAIATPGVPATTVTASNTTGTVVAVTITGGTLTSVKVNTVQVGTTPGTYLVPVGGNISITYTVAPAWAWALPVTSGPAAQNANALPVASGGTNFASGQVLMVDTGTNIEAATVAAGSTGTSVALTAGLIKAHNTGISFGILIPVPSFATADSVPAAAGWGF